MGKPCRAEQATYDSMAHAHCVIDTKFTNTHTGCVILIAFTLQQWVHERASMLSYTYAAVSCCLLRRECHSLLVVTSHLPTCIETVHYLESDGSLGKFCVSQQARRVSVHVG